MSNQLDDEYAWPFNWVLVIKLILSRVNLIFTQCDNLIDKLMEASQPLRNNKAAGLYNIRIEMKSAGDLLIVLIVWWVDSLIK